MPEELPPLEEWNSCLFNDQVVFDSYHDADVIWNCPHCSWQIGGKPSHWLEGDQVYQCNNCTTYLVLQGNRLYYLPPATDLENFINSLNLD